MSVGLTAANLGPAAEFSRLLTQTGNTANRHTAAGGIEYGFLGQFILRTGYHYEPNQRYYTAGFGLKLQHLHVDFSYLRSPELQHPLQHTLRFGIGYSVKN